MLPIVDRNIRRLMSVAEPEETLDILYVEDDADTARTMVRVLGRDRFARVHVAESAEHALEILRTLRFQIILIDPGLTGMRGLEAVRAIHEMSAETPIIIFTGRPADENDTEFRSQIIKAGADDYILKGTSIFQTRQRIRFARLRHLREQADRMMRGVDA